MSDAPAGTEAGTGPRTRKSPSSPPSRLIPVTLRGNVPAVLSILNVRSMTAPATIAEPKSPAASPLGIEGSVMAGPSCTSISGSVVFPSPISVIRYVPSSASSLSITSVVDRSPVSAGSNRTVIVSEAPPATEAGTPPASEKSSALPAANETLLMASVPSPAVLSMLKVRSIAPRGTLVTPKGAASPVLVMTMSETSGPSCTAISGTPPPSAVILIRSKAIEFSPAFARTCRTRVRLLPIPGIGAENGWNCRPSGVPSPTPLKSVSAARGRPPTTAESDSNCSNCCTG